MGSVQREVVYLERDRSDTPQFSDQPVFELSCLLFEVEAYCFEERGIVYSLKMHCFDDSIDCTLCQQSYFVNVLYKAYSNELLFLLLFPKEVLWASKL